MTDPVFLRSQLRDPLFYRRHESAILRAQRDGRIVNDVKPPPISVKTMPVLQRKVEPPPSSEPAPLARSAGSDFRSGP